MNRRGKWLAMETALMRIAAYPRTRAEELSVEGARAIARAALAYCEPANRPEPQTIPPLHVMREQ